VGGVDLEKKMLIRHNLAWGEGPGPTHIGEKRTKKKEINRFWTRSVSTGVLQKEGEGESTLEKKKLGQ